jgi:GTP-binding protein EngB required for normal cell division
MSGAYYETTGATSFDQVRIADTPFVTRLHVALAGQPNMGKSTVFNLPTWLRQQVGKWPGKTVEQKSGTPLQARFTVMNE